MRIARSLCVFVVIAGAWIAASEQRAHAGCDCSEIFSCECDDDWVITGGGTGQPAPRASYPAGGSSDGIGRGGSLANVAGTAISTASVSGAYPANNPGAAVHAFDGDAYVENVVTYWSFYSQGFFPPPVVSGSGGVPVPQGVNPNIDANGVGPSGDPSKADPVDPISGEFVIHETDLEFPSFGIPFRLVRTYRSRVDYNGPFGPGWDEIYNQRLFNLPEVTLEDVPSAPGYSRLENANVPSPPIIPDAGLCGPSLLMTTGEATTIRFRELSRTGSQIDYRSSAAHLTLVGTDGPNGPTWALRSPDGSARSFDADGRLVAWRDANGIGLTIAWSGSGAGMNVSAVTDSVGRTILFGYDGADRLYRVSEETSALEAMYTYLTNGGLGTATKGDGRAESYEYDLDTSRGKGEWVPEQQLRAGCERTCARTDATCDTGGACDTPVEEAFEACLDWLPECRSHCSTGCYQACLTEGQYCDSYCEVNSRAALVAECADIYQNGGIREACEGCDFDCNAQAEDYCTEQLNNPTKPPGITSDQWAACVSNLHSCCADGSQCGENSCNADGVGEGEQCETTCQQAFMGDQPIDSNCSTDPPPSGCLEIAIDRCKNGGYDEQGVPFLGCASVCAGVECLPSCNAGCSEDACLGLDLAGTCTSSCTDACVAAGRDAGLGARYGYLSDLNFNIVRVYDGAGRLYLQNTYGTSPWSPDFDAVTSQQFGEYNPKLARWDLVASASGEVVASLPAWADPLIDEADAFEPVDICPFTCQDAPYNPSNWDELMVPVTGNFLVFSPGPVNSPVTGFPVNKTLTQIVNPTLVTFSTNAQGVLVGKISRRTSTTNYFATTATSLPITLNNGATATLATSTNGAVTITGTTAAKDQLRQMGSMTLFTDPAKRVQAYPGAPNEVLRASSGSCTAPFTFQRISQTEIRLSPPTACTGELWLTPMAGRYPDQAAADVFPRDGLQALSTSGFHPVTLSPTRDGYIWRSGIDGRRVREAAPTRAGMTDAANTALAQYTATPMFSAPTTTSGLGEPLYVFHQVAADYRQPPPTPPAPSDLPWQQLDPVAVDFPLSCDATVPETAIRGSGPRPTQATAITDFHGARWTQYADEDGNVLRSINHDTGAVWSFNYDPIGQLISIEHPDRARTCLIRDSLGNVTRRVRMPAVIPGLPTPDPILEDFKFHPLTSALTEIDDPRTPGAWLEKVVRDAVGNPMMVQEAGGVTTATFVPVGGVGPDRFEIKTATAPGNAVTAVTYDNGTVASITTDPSGAHLTDELVPDEAGRIVSRTGSLGLAQTWSYDGPVLNFTDWHGDGHNGHQTFQYDGDGALATVLVGQPGAERLRTDFTYDVTGALTRTMNTALDGTAATVATCQDVAPGGRVREMVSGEGIRTRYTRDGEGHVTQILAGDLGPSPRTWDDGCLDHPTGGTGTFTMGTFGYDVSGHLVSATDERGRLTTIAYDGLGRPVMITRPDGTQERRGYDALGNIVWNATYTTANLPPYRMPSWSDAGLHAATQYFFDARNRLFEIWRWHFDGAQLAVGDGYSITHFDFDDVAHTITRRDDAGYQWVSRFDAAGRLVEERAPDGTAKTYSYPDPRTVRISEPGPSGTITHEMSLTAWGDVASEGPRIGTTTYPLATTQFDELLRPVSSTSHTGETTSLTYDAFGRTTRQVHAVPGGASETLTIGYDRDGRPRTRASVADGATTGTWTWQYDTLGREIDALDPGGGHTTTTYVLGSQLPNVITDPRGVQFQHSWSTNSNALFLNAVDPGGPDTSLSYVWDDRGNLVSASRTDEGSTQVANIFQYDSIDDRTKETDNQLPSAWTRTAQFDGRGLPTKTWLNTSTISRTFDTLGRLSTVKWGSESTALATYAYSGLDFRLTRSLQNGIATSYAYDSLGRQTSQADVKGGTTTVASFAWQVPLDGVPRRQDFRRGAAAIEASAFTVDAALRTIDEDSAPTGTFGLTPTTSWTSANSTATATLGTQDWRYTLDGRSAWSRRVRGTSDTTDYLRDARDAVTRIGTQNTTLDARGALLSDGSVQTLYDALGQVKQLQSGTKIRTYKRDALGRVVSEVNEGGNVTRYAWDGSTRIVRQRSDGTTFDVTVDGADLDEHIATIWGSNRQFLHQDRRGSVYMVSNTSGVATEWTSYTAYGEPTLRKPDGTATPITLVNGQYGFNGLPQDFVLGVVDMRARVYRPTLGRFLSPDPFGLIDGTNRFGFVAAAPLVQRDPMGLNRQFLLDAQRKSDADIMSAEHMGLSYQRPFSTWFQDLTSSVVSFGAEILDGETRGAFLPNMPKPDYAGVVFDAIGGDPDSEVSSATQGILIAGSLAYGGWGLGKGIGAFFADAGAVDGTSASGRLLLPAAGNASVIPNAMSAAETAFAREITDLRGGTFTGAPTSNFPGVDGWLESTPASLKEYTGTSPAGVLRHAASAARSAQNAGYTGVEVFIRAQNVAASSLSTMKGLISIPTEGTVSAIYILTQDGWSIFPGVP